MPAALLGAWTMAHLCDELQIDFEVALFNKGFAARQEDTEDAYRRRRAAATAGLKQTQGSAADRLTTTVNHYIVKPFERRWRESEPTLAGLFYTASEPRRAFALARRDPESAPPVSLFEKAANVDEFNLIHAAERMARLGAQVRVLMVLADGMTRGSMDALARSVAAVESGGTTVIGIGIGDHTVDAAYKRHEVVEKPQDLAQAMVQGTRGALRRSLALFGLDTWWFRASEFTNRQEKSIA
jgi:tRNA(Met) C34 N-acetyltransferase TmcA